MFSIFGIFDQLLSQTTFGLQSYTFQSSFWLCIFQNFFLFMMQISYASGAYMTWYKVQSCHDMTSGHTPLCQHSNTSRSIGSHTGEARYCLTIRRSACESPKSCIIYTLFCNWITAISCLTFLLYKIRMIIIGSVLLIRFIRR